MQTLPHQGHLWITFFSTLFPRIPRSNNWVVIHPISCQRSATPQTCFRSMCHVRHPPPHQAEGKTMAAFVCPPTFHHWGLGWFCISVGQKRVQPHSRRWQREMSLEWHKNTVSSERLNRGRLAITAYCPLNTNILCLFKCSNVFWLTQCHDISPFIFLRKTTFGIIVINCIMLHSVTESVDFGTKQWKTKKNVQNSKRSWRLIEADFNRQEKKKQVTTSILLNALCFSD